LRRFTTEELSQYDGTDGRPAYVAYKGKVYDVSDGPTWVDGLHSEHSAGMDLTPDMEDAPHGDEVMEGMPVVGEFVG
jgi:predicted heme/steroid binding protein